MFHANFQGCKSPRLNFLCFFVSLFASRLLTVSNFSVAWISTSLSKTSIEVSLATRVAMAQRSNRVGDWGQRSRLNIIDVKNSVLAETWVVHGSQLCWWYIQHTCHISLACCNMLSENRLPYFHRFFLVKIGFTFHPKSQGEQSFEVFEFSSWSLTT